MWLYNVRDQNSTAWYDTMSAKPGLIQVESSLRLHVRAILVSLTTAPLSINL